MKHFDDEDTEALILVYIVYIDASNAFNCLNRHVTLLNCGIVCPALSHSRGSPSHGNVCHRDPAFDSQVGWYCEASMVRRWLWCWLKAGERPQSCTEHHASTLPRTLLTCIYMCAVERSLVSAWRLLTLSVISSSNSGSSSAIAVSRLHSFPQQTLELNMCVCVSSTNLVSLLQWGRLMSPTTINYHGRKQSGLSSQRWFLAFFCILDVSLHF